MANANNPYGPVRPGPKPLFTERIEVRLRQDQTQALARIAGVLDRPVSDVIRWAIDEAIDAVESVPTFKTLERRRA